MQIDHDFIHLKIIPSGVAVVATTRKILSAISTYTIFYSNDVKSINQIAKNCWTLSAALLSAKWLLHFLPLLWYVARNWKAYLSFVADKSNYGLEKLHCGRAHLFTKWLLNCFWIDGTINTLIKHYWTLFCIIIFRPSFYIQTRGGLDSLDFPIKVKLQC